MEIEEPTCEAVLASSGASWSVSKVPFVEGVGGRTNDSEALTTVSAFVTSTSGSSSPVPSASFEATLVGTASDSTRRDGSSSTSDVEGVGGLLERTPLSTKVTAW